MTDILLSMLEQYGMKEVDGLESNPEIIAMGKELGFDIADDSTVAWCSLAMNYFAKKCGYEYSGSLAARSWLKMPVMALKPTLGDVVIFWRNDPASWEGHVGLFINWNDKYIWVLAGNQSNSLNIIAYPRERLLGFRKLRKLNKD